MSWITAKIIGWGRTGSRETQLRKSMWSSSSHYGTATASHWFWGLARRPLTCTTWSLTMTRVWNSESISLQRLTPLRPMKASPRWILGTAFWNSTLRLEKWGRSTKRGFIWLFKTLVLALPWCLWECTSKSARLRWRIWLCFQTQYPWTPSLWWRLGALVSIIPRRRILPGCTAAQRANGLSPLASAPATLGMKNEVSYAKVRASFFSLKLNLSPLSLLYSNENKLTESDLTWQYNTAQNYESTYMLNLSHLMCWFLICSEILMGVTLGCWTAPWRGVICATFFIVFYFIELVGRMPTYNGVFCKGIRAVWRSGFSF